MLWFFYRVLARLILRPLWRRFESEKLAHLMAHLRECGTGVAIKGNLRIANPANTTFGDDVCINPGLIVRGTGELIVGSHVHMGEDIRIITSNHQYEGTECLPYSHNRINKSVVIGDCVWICDAVIITPGVDVGEGAILAAGAVVTKDVPPLAIVGGSPAKIIRYRDATEYYNLKKTGQYLGWPRDFHLLCDRKVTVKRPER